MLISHNNVKQECGSMSIGAVPNCPEMVVNSVKAVMGSKCKCMDRGKEMLK